MTGPGTTIVRAETARVVELGAALCLVGGDGAIHRVDGDSAAVVRRVLELVGRPTGRDAIVAAISAEAGADAGPIVDDIVALLERTGAVRVTGGAAGARARPPPPPAPCAATSSSASPARSPRCTRPAW